MHNVLLLNIVECVILDCKSEREFTQFTYAVEAGTGWEWIFARPGLKGKVTIPNAPSGVVRLSVEMAETLVHAARVTKDWSMAGLYHNGQSLSASGAHALGLRIARSTFFSDLVRKLGESISASRYVSTNPAAGQTFATSHEGGITVTSLAHGNYAAWKLVGDVSSGWAGLTVAGQSFLDFMDQDGNEPPSKRLAKVGRAQADQMFGSLQDDSGGSCLLGVMIADIKNEFGQALRVVSFTGNMCGTKGAYAAQTTRGQGSQVHMEIFHLERLGALMNFLSTRPRQTISAIDVGILGLKTNAVVSENVMCIACNSTKTTELDNRLRGTAIGLSFGVSFLSL